MAKVGGQKLPKRGSDAEGTKPVKTPANGKGGATIRGNSGIAKSRMGKKGSGC